MSALEPVLQGFFTDRLHRQRQAIRLQYSPNAGIDVVIRTTPCVPSTTCASSTSPLPSTHSGRRSRTPPFGVRATIPLLQPRAEHVVPILFVDEEGSQHRVMSGAFDAVARFTDLDGTRWQINNSGLQQVPADDSDLTPTDAE